MKKMTLIFIFTISTISAFSQDGNPAVNMMTPAPVLSFNSKHYGQQDALNPVRGNPFANPGNFFAMLTNKFNFNVPTRFRYTLANGINFQAGLLMNSRQPKLGATMALPRGLNISAGYGASMPTFGRQGFSAMGRNPGIQISASYRIFKRK